MHIDLVLTKHAADDQVGPASVAEYWNGVTEEAIHRFDHPRRCSQTGQYCHLPSAHGFNSVQSVNKCLA